MSSLVTNIPTEKSNMFASSSAPVSPKLQRKLSEDTFDKDSLLNEIKQNESQPAVISESLNEENVDIIKVCNVCFCV